MGDKKAFTKDEDEVMDLLRKAHNKFVLMQKTHPSEMQDWVFFLHRLQGLMMERVARRDYPNEFNSISKQ